MIAFSGMVVHHVEDDLDARVVERLDHRLELPDMVGAIRRGRIANVRREKPDRVIAPIIGETALDQVMVADEMMDR